jgi:hypothetical protein
MEQNTTLKKTGKSNSKTLLGILCIAIILLIVTMISNKKMEKEHMIRINTISEQKTTDAQIEQISVQSNSDEIDAIEADLNNTNIDNIDL